MRPSLGIARVGCGLTLGPPLERIGAGAFEYDFGALDDADDPFTKSYTNLLYDYPSSLPKVPIALTVLSVR